MKQIELAKKINVSRQTLKNWEKTKPELIRLILLGIAADKKYMDFYELFPKTKLGFFMFNDFYIDFYMRFINYFRKNITNPLHYYNEDNLDINSTFIYYLMDHNKDEIFDNSLTVNEISLTNLQRPELQKPISNVDIELSTYILKNTLDDFETLIRDSMYQMRSKQDFFLYAVYFAVNYLIYKLEPSLTYQEKSFRQEEIYNNIGLKLYKKDTSAISQDEILKKYLSFRETYTVANINQIQEELDLYLHNDFYIPTFILKLTNSQKLSQ